MGSKERLADLIRGSGLSQSEIARRLEPPEKVTWVNNRVTGYSTLKADDVPRLAKVLGVDCSAFYDEACKEVREHRAGYAAARPATPKPGTFRALHGEEVRLNMARDLFRVLAEATDEDLERLLKPRQEPQEQPHRRETGESAPQ